ncbi:16S rRNA (guanine(966)-N(2))-methyltransferase RsmD [uncultured Corynebacterium sp.]|uniref:16S rRNA (guanine(966)-N(2))-methyltransferase RsmD n=1 Tax=uncultured Corynebacterium sp. TaxID=159447 RepID=UPI0025D26088|nr:16S rRNA (guanine(966)-N(2))-methyltransferase RsmD [uncultured Corynebacterium sp.]
MSRIIAGTARGRKLVAPKGEDTRPTTDRAREAIFSSWSSRFGIEGTTVLDLFAGSGALGLEAASRGADEVVLVESAPAACRAIRANIDAVGHPRVTLAEMKASTYLAGAPTEHFDRVIADPPYELAGEAVTEMLDVLRAALVDGAVVTVERHYADDETTWPEGFEILEQKLKRRIHGLARFDTAIFRRGDDS